MEGSAIISTKGGQATSVLTRLSIVLWARHSFSVPALEAHLSQIRLNTWKLSKKILIVKVLWIREQGKKLKRKTRKAYKNYYYLISQRGVSNNRRSYSLWTRKTTRTTSQRNPHWVSLHLISQVSRVVKQTLGELPRLSDLQTPMQKIHKALNPSNCRRNSLKPSSTLTMTNWKWYTLQTSHAWASAEASEWPRKTVP